VATLDGRLGAARRVIRYFAHIEPAQLIEAMRT